MNVDRVQNSVDVSVEHCDLLLKRVRNKNWLLSPIFSWWIQMAPLKTIVYLCTWEQQKGYVTQAILQVTFRRIAKKHVK